MFTKNDKKRLYWLIDQYLSNKIDSWTFCNEYYYCYDLEIDRQSLTNIEKKVFSSLSSVANRFSDDKEDLERYPGTYFTEEQLKKKIIRKLVVLDYYGSHLQTKYSSNVRSERGNYQIISGS